jgi:ABC-2 type transport system ATP-binding protein
VSTGSSDPHNYPVTPLLEAVDLVKDYPGVRAVDGISFRVARGSCFGLLGPNGAGKTTAMEMLEGISRPVSGRVLYNGRALDRAYREDIGIQFQTTALQDFQTVRESLTMFASLYHKSADIGELIGLCNLEEILDRDTRKLSGGQRQRLLLAIALVNDPQLVFLDEPTTGLDPQARRNFWGLIEMVLQRGKTIVLTTHYMEEAQRLCDDIVIVDKGRIITMGEPAALVKQHLPAVIARLPATAWPVDKPLPENSELRNGFIEICADDQSLLLAQLESSCAHLSDLKIEAPNLEDLFLKLTGHALRN